MRKIIAAALLAAVLCGCGAGKSEAPPVQPQPEADVTPLPISTPAPTSTPEPTPTPEPAPKSLGLGSGAEMQRYECGENGDYMDYWLLAPENAVEGMPLLVFLHGDGNRANPQSLENNPIQRKIAEIYGGKQSFLTLIPNTRLYSWTAGTTEETLLSLIAHVAETYAVDMDKTMLCGHSRGAIGTWCLISRHPDMFSAAAPISCGCDEPLDYESMAEVPVWGFCGNIGEDGSHYLPAMERIAGNIRDAGGSAKIDILSGCDHAAAEAAAFSEELFEWLLSQ